MFDWLASLRPELVWGLFTRALGLVLLISFASLAGQIVLGSGRGGGLPVALRLRKIRRDFPTWRRFVYFPTLLWVNDSDAMLRALACTGLLAAAALVYGGAFSFWAILVCYVCYLSLDLAIGLIFPWDCLMFECVILALFIPPTHSLPNLSAVAAPAPALAWAYRLLVFRVMFGFGKQKFLGSTSKDLSYLKGFLLSQPLPSPLGWYAQKLPTKLLKPAVLFMFFAEIPAPFFVFVPGPLSVVCAAVTTLLMIGIHLMGSFGYFSVLTIAACIPLLDNVTPTHLHIAGMFAAGAPVVVNAFVVVHTVSCCFAFLFNSWIGQSWHLWSAWYRLPEILQLPLRFFRLLHPFRWLHPYGVFPPHTSPDVKMSLLAEVSWDEKEWHELVFHFSPTHPKSPPKFVAPHHPRGDQAVIYETFGMNPTSLISSIVGPWDPYSYGSRPGADVLLQRILEGHGLDFLKSEALESHPEPPKVARVSTIMLESVSVKEHFDTGDWWKRTYVGPHAPPRGFDPHFWEDFLPEPEQWHFDAIFWRRRSKLSVLMQRSVARREDPMDLALIEGGDLTGEDVRRFWDEFLPMLAREERVTFESLPDVVARVRERFGRRDLRALSRLLGRFSMLLVARLEPHYLGRWKATIPARNYFELWMVTHHVIAEGRDDYLATMAEPLSVIARLPEMTPESGLYLLSIFRFESMTFEAQKLRLITAYASPHEEEEKRRLEEGVNLTPTERKLARLAESFSGFFCVMPAIRRGFKGPRFDRGYPELYPSFRQLESGEVQIREYAKAPEGVTLPASTRSVAAE